MEVRVATYSEYSISSSVRRIRNLDLPDAGGRRRRAVYFQPNVNIELAISQIVSASNSIRALIRPASSPIIIQYNASSVPVLQLSLSSDTLDEQQLYDYGLYRVRQALAPIPGLTLPPLWRKIPPDHGGIDPAALLARSLTPTDSPTRSTPRT